MSVDSIRAMSQAPVARVCCYPLRPSSSVTKRLSAIAQSIQAHHVADIFQANELDLQAAAEEKLAAPLLSPFEVFRAKAERVIDGCTRLRSFPIRSA